MLRIILSICTAVIIGFSYYIAENVKDKTELTHSTGTIVYLNKTFLNHPSSNKEKYRYLSIASYPFIFEIFADNDVKNIDCLKTGDKITVYYSNMNENASDAMNTTLRFIEKDNRILFQKPQTFIYVCLLFILLTVVVAIGSFIQYKRGKLEL